MFVCSMNFSTKQTELVNYFCRRLCDGLVRIIWNSNRWAQQTQCKINGTFHYWNFNLYQVSILIHWSGHSSCFGEEECVWHIWNWCISSAARMGWGRSRGGKWESQKYEWWSDGMMKRIISRWSRGKFGTPQGNKNKKAQNIMDSRVKSIMADMFTKVWPNFWLVL